MFGTSFGNLPAANQGALFGAQNNNLQQQQKGTGLFGAANTQGNMFGNTQPVTGGGLFGTNNAAQNTGGLFGTQPTNPATGFMSQPTQGQGLFGNQQQQQQQQPNAMGGGLFGNSNPAPQGGIFGNGNTQANTMGGGGIFGGQQQNPIQGGGLFGQQQQQQQPQTGMAGGLFGIQTTAGGMIGGQQQNSGTGLFGQQNNQQQQGPFGAASSNANQAFLANQQNPVGGNLFGAPSNGTGIFGNQQTTPSSSAGGLFNSFAPANTANQTNNLFGNQQNTAFNANNKLGGTSWGVPTTLTSNPSGLVNPAGAQPMQPVRSKNTKLDQKHQVKCISALDQFNGLCKE